MAAGIFNSLGGVLGAAAHATRPRIDLGPSYEWTAGGREARQVYDEGVAAMLAHARQSRGLTPMDSQQTPGLTAYQSASRELTSLDPALAAQLSHTGATVGLMEQRRRAGRRLIKGPPPTAGLGYGGYVSLAPTPSGYLVEQAHAGLAPRYYR